MLGFESDGRSPHRPDRHHNLAPSSGRTMRKGNHRLGATRATASVVSATLVGVIALGAAFADAVGDFYKGRALDLYIGYSVGGAYDLYARVIGRYLGAHIPGNPTTVPKNLEGAGSLRHPGRSGDRQRQRRARRFASEPAARARSETCASYRSRHRYGPAERARSRRRETRRQGYRHDARRALRADDARRVGGLASASQ